MTTAGGFKYSPKEMAEIAAALGVDVDHIDCGHVQWIVADWVEADESSVPVELEKNRRIADLAEKLLDEIDADTGDPDHFDGLGSPTTLAGHLMVALNWAEKVEDENPPRKGRRPQIPLALSTRLIEFWECSGRRVGRSTRVDALTDAQGSTGPLVRFLLAACAPVFEVELTADAAASTIRAYRRSADMAELPPEIFAFPPF